jgi:hypothetical protein
VIDRAIDETLSGNLSQRAFDHAWGVAPRFYTNTIDRDDAEYWFEVGRRCGRVEQTQITNDDLREMARVVREKLR